MRELTARALDRAQYQVIRRLNRLPHPVQRLLSGSGPIVRDGLTLHPEMQLILSMRRRMGARNMSHGPTVEVARRRLKKEALAFAGPPLEVGAVRELVLQTRGGPLPARHYAPPDVRGPVPLLVFFHGGGFVLGDLDTHDAPCRFLCREGGMQVLSVAYRLAPEHPFPTPVEDALDAFAAARAMAPEWGADPSRIGVGGDSAGASLSAVVAQCARGQAGPKMQLLLYPALDRTVPRPSLELFADGFFLTRADVEWFAAQYIGDADPNDPRACPMLSSELSGLPPALIVTAGFDPLRDEGEAYAWALQEAGSRAVLQRFDGLIHGFANLTGISRACDEAMRAVATQTRELLQ